MKFVGLEKWKSKISDLEKQPTLLKVFFYIILACCAFKGISIAVNLLMNGLYYNIDFTFNDFNEFDLLLAQISNTFIVLSLTSVLSTNIGTVYWIDIKDEKLVRPFFLCFYALTTYLLTLMSISIYVYFHKEILELLISFFMSVALLIFLTISMINVYFNRERIKNKYGWIYIEANIYVDKPSGVKIFNLGQLLKSNQFDNRKKHEKKYLEWESNRRTIISKAKKLDGDEIFGDIEKDTLEKILSYPYTIGKTEETKEAKEKNEELSLKLYEKTIQAINDLNLECVNENIELLILAENKRVLRDTIEYAYIQNNGMVYDILKNLNTCYNTLSKKISDYNDPDFVGVDDILWLQDMISEQARNIISGVSYKNITYQQLREILSSIKPDSDADENYRMLIEESSTAQTDQFLQKYKNRAICLNYVPIKELYLSYMNRDVQLMKYYIQFIVESNEKTVYYIKDNLSKNSKIDLYGKLNMKTISEADEEYLNLIFRREEIDPILPPKMIQDLKDLIYIEL